MHASGPVGAGPGGPALLLVSVLALIVWAAVGARLAHTSGGPVDHPNRIAQWYGYAVCLIAVLTILFSVNSLVGGLFTLSDPLRAEGRFEPALTSFEAYRATLDRRPMPPVEGGDTAREPTEAELRRRYEALREERIAQSRFDARRAVVTSGLLLALAIALFVGHWRWLRGGTDRAADRDARPVPGS